MWNIGLENFIEEKIRSAFNQLRMSPLNLGGVSYFGGGSTIYPAGYIGQLPQTRVAFDFSEDASDIIPSGGMSLLDNLNRIRYRVSNLENAVWSGGDIAITFTQLADTPTSYSGYGNYILRVKATEDGIEFIPAVSGGGGSTTFLQLTDTPSTYSGNAGAFLLVNSTEDGVEFKQAQDVLGQIAHSYQFFVDGALSVESSIQSVIVESSVYITTFHAMLAQSGTSGQTTITLSKNGATIATLILQYNETYKTVSVDQSATAGDILSISITSVASGASTLSAAVAYNSGSGIIVGGGGGSSNGISLYVVDAPPAQAGAFDDEFNDSVFSGWSIYNHSGVSENLTITEESRGLKLSLDTDYTYGILGVYKSTSSITYPYTFFTKVSVNALRDQNLKAGILILESPTNPSARVIFVHLNTVGFESYQAIDSFNSYNDTLYTNWIQDSVGRITNHVYIKVTLYRTAPNNLYMRSGMSLDGKGWIDFSYTNALPFIAPQGIGLGVWKSSSVTGMNAYFQFFRGKGGDYLTTNLDGRILQL